MITGGIRRFVPLLFLGISSGDEGPQAGDTSLAFLQTAYAIKWAVIAAIVLAVVLYLVGGYFHARRRMSKGLPPLYYHKVRLLFPPRETDTLNEVERDM